MNHIVQCFTNSINLSVLKDFDSAKMQPTRYRNEERYLVHEHNVDSKHCPLEPLPDAWRHALGSTYNRRPLPIGCLPFQRPNVLPKESFRCGDVTSLHGAVRQLVVVDNLVVRPVSRKHNDVLYASCQHGIAILPLGILLSPIVSEVDKSPCIHRRVSVQCIACI